MITVYFTLPDGEVRAIDAAPGESLMFVALTNDVAGILGECGGCAVCGTCHVYVDAEQLPLLAPMSDTEENLLDCLGGARLPTSRLGCQVALTESMDGLRVAIPPDEAGVP